MTYDRNEPEAIIEYKYIVDKIMLEEVKTLFKEYAQSLGIDLSFQAFDNELQTLPGKYCMPEGTLILASVNGAAAGCIALRKLSPDVCEMKRLYVRPDYRKSGIGGKLIGLIIEEAKSWGTAICGLIRFHRWERRRSFINPLDFIT